MASRVTPFRLAGAGALLAALVSLTAVAFAGAPAPASPSGAAPGAAAAQAAPPAQAAAKRPKLILRKTRYGRVLFSGGRRALYLFTKDSRRKSRCYRNCAVAWPPFFAKRKPIAGKGVKKGLIGLVRRAGGRRMVTYRGRPLYFYQHDPKGRVLCQDVFEFGGRWLVVNRKGRAVR